jgi:hypothetical protein
MHVVVFVCYEFSTQTHLKVILVFFDKAEWGTLDASAAFGATAGLLQPARQLVLCCLLSPPLDSVI